MKVWKSNSDWILAGWEQHELEGSLDDSLPGPPDHHNSSWRPADVPLGVSGWIQPHQRHLRHQRCGARSLLGTKCSADRPLRVKLAIEEVAEFSTFIHSCPVDTFVFPELGRSRDGDSLEARFNAFKIPESNFLVFEATVKTCRDGCQPAYCNGLAGRSEASFGRRKRSLNDTDIAEGEETVAAASGEEILGKRNGKMNFVASSKRLI